MFRFLHAADIHLDSPLIGLDEYEGAPVEALRGATRRAFENLVQLALDEAVDFVLIAGDLYDGDWRDFSTGLFFTRQMARLHAAGIPVVLIAGNHDAASVLTRHLPLPPNVHRLSSRAAESKRLEHLPVVVHGRGFPQRAVPENLVPEYPRPQPGLFNIGLLHTSLTGAPGHDTYAPCSLADLTGKGYDYWALGHLHQPQVLARDPWVVFPGNLQGRHVRETGARGCRLVSVSDALEVRAAEHRSLDVLRWACLEIDLARSETRAQALTRIGEGLQAAAAEAEGRLLAARLRLTGASALHGELQRHLPALRAECIARAQVELGDAVWIEEVELATVPRYDLEELAARDDLTRIVLETLDAAAADDLEPPAEAAEMLRLLPAELRTDLEADLRPQRCAALLDEVRAILLEALSAAGPAEAEGASAGRPPPEADPSAG